MEGSVCIHCNIGYSDEDNDNHDDDEDDEEDGEDDEDEDEEEEQEEDEDEEMGLVDLVFSRRGLGTVTFESDEDGVERYTEPVQRRAYGVSRELPRALPDQANNTNAVSHTRHDNREVEANSSLTSYDEEDICSDVHPEHPEQPEEQQRRSFSWSSEDETTVAEPTRGLNVTDNQRASRVRDSHATGQGYVDSRRNVEQGGRGRSQYSAYGDSRQNSAYFIDTREERIQRRMASEDSSEYEYDSGDLYDSEPDLLAV